MAALDYIKRARHAWQEFRQPSQLDIHQDPQHPGLNEVDRRGSVYPIAPIEPSAALKEYRILVGIHQDKSFAAKGFIPNRRPTASAYGRPAPNMGIYTTVCDREIKSKRSYKFASRLINSCLGLQIVVAAALTALGAASGSHSAVTVFGAINTVIAGFLTYLKGSGLPNRLKYFQHEWGKVREYIEQRERDFTLGVPGLSVEREVNTIRQMYENVRMDIETNTPDRFVSVTALRQHSAHIKDPGPALARPAASFSTDSFHKRWNEKEAEVNTAINKKEAEANFAVNKARNTASGMLSNLSHLKDVFEDKAREMGHLEKEIEADGRHFVEDKTKEVGRREQEIEANSRQFFEDKKREVVEQVDSAIKNIGTQDSSSKEGTGRTGDR